MACIAEVQPPVLQVEQPYEHCHKHPAVVVLHEFLVHPVGYLRRLEPVLAECAEEPCRHRHEESRRHPFSAHVAQAEVEPVTRHHEVIQVAPYLLRRHHLGVEVQSLALRKHVWQHRHLYLPRNPQLALYALLGRRRLLQLVVGLLQPEQL